MFRWPRTVLFLVFCQAGIAQQSQPPNPIPAAQAKLQTGDIAGATAILASAVQANSQTAAPVYLLLADCYLKTQDSKAAEAILRGGLRAHPDSPVLERALGELLFHAKVDSTEAGTHLARAAKLLPRDPEARHYFAQWAYLNARDRVCTQQEQEALALPGLNDLALLQMYTLLGMCESRLEDADAARTAFEHADQANTRRTVYDPVAAMQYLQFVTRYNDDAAAGRIVDAILKRVPEFGPAHLEKAKQYDRANEPARAIEEARLALAASGNDANVERAAHVLMARCLSALGDAEGSLREQQWIDTHPNPETPRR
jgi:thioredoxin-like negative regulator of GroEL